MPPNFVRLDTTLPDVARLVTAMVQARDAVECRSWSHLSGADTGGAYCLLEVNLASGIGVPRHTHTREDEAYFVLAGEFEVVVGDEKFVLRAGDTLIAPRGIPHQLRNSGDVENHYLLVFSPAGFEEFVRTTALPAPNDAIAPTEPPAVAVRNVHELAAEYGIQ